MNFYQSSSPTMNTGGPNKGNIFLLPLCTIIAFCFVGAVVVTGKIAYLIGQSAGEKKRLSTERYEQQIAQNLNMRMENYEKNELYESRLDAISGLRNGNGQQQ